MSKLEGLKTSLSGGWKALRSDFALSGYAVLSVAFVYVLIANHSMISSSLETSQTPFFLYLLIICTLTALALGAIIARKLNKRDHSVFNLIGIIFSLVLLFPLDGNVKLLLLAVLGGISSSIGLPDVLNYVVGLTRFENRGAASGIFLFIVYVLVFLFSILISDLTTLAVTMLVVKMASLILANKCNYSIQRTEDLPSASSKVSTKLYFFVAWFIFLLVDAIVINVLSQWTSQSALYTISLYSTLIGLFSLILGGFVMDVIGRKKIMVFAYAYLGVEYALVTLSYSTFINFTFIDGIAWGILTTLFTLVIWGDLANSESRPKYLAVSLGITTSLFFLKNAFQLMNLQLPPEQTFPLTSIFLFIAVIITLYLPETLPDKVVQARDLQDYIERAKRIKEKYD
jgi:MFS family permease